MGGDGMCRFRARGVCVLLYMCGGQKTTVGPSLLQCLRQSLFVVHQSICQAKPRVSEDGITNTYHCAWLLYGFLEFTLGFSWLYNKDCIQEASFSTIICVYLLQQQHLYDIYPSAKSSSMHDNTINYRHRVLHHSSKTYFLFQN